MTLEEIEIQEQILLSSFTYDDAWQMGLWARAHCVKHSLKVAVSIEKAGQTVMQFAMEGTSPDNDRWIAGKRRMVNLTHHSSLYAKEKLKLKAVPVEEAFHLDGRNYYCAGGGVPVFVKGVGVAGSVTVSGLKDHEDHALAIEIIQHFYQGQAKV